MAERLATAAEFKRAEEVVNSDAAIRVYASCEWDDLHDDGKQWMAIIISEAQRELLAALEALTSLSIWQAHGSEFDRRRLAVAQQAIAKAKGSAA